MRVQIVCNKHPARRRIRRQELPYKIRKVLFRPRGIQPRKNLAGHHAHRRKQTQRPMTNIIVLLLRTTARLHRQVRCCSFQRLNARLLIDTHRMRWLFSSGKFRSIQIRLANLFAPLLKLGIVGIAIQPTFDFVRLQTGLILKKPIQY